MKPFFALLALAALAAALLSGCRSTPVSDNWPYQGPPMVGTNTIPVPKW